MKVLLIEDEPKILNAVKEGLLQDGFVVDTASDGELGYDLAKTGDYDVIILDRMLPKLSGEEVCSKLRSEHNSVPILMLTAKSQVEDKVFGLNCGADDYLTKPFSFIELVARLKALARRPKPLTPNVLTCDNLKLDTIDQKVTRAGVEIALSKKEYQLLEYLVKNKNRKLAKEKIIEQVWDFEADVLPNTLEQYIGMLRTKIEKPFKNDKNLIKTYRGFGYSLTDED